MATTEFAPPEGITPAMGGIILAESVQPEHKVAWLIEAAIEGAIDLVEEGGKTVRLVRTAPGSAPTAEVLDTMFGGRDGIELGKYDPSFAAGWTKVRDGKSVVWGTSVSVRLVLGGRTTTDYTYLCVFIDSTRQSSDSNE